MQNEFKMLVPVISTFILCMTKYGVKRKREGRDLFVILFLINCQNKISAAQ